jgi:hypothetical protein
MPTSGNCSVVDSGQLIVDAWRKICSGDIAPWYIHSLPKGPQHMKPHNPLRAMFTVRRSELPLTLMMFIYFFLVITSFWILKPLKKALFIEFYDQQ